MLCIPRLLSPTSPSTLALGSNIWMGLSCNVRTPVVVGTAPFSLRAPLPPTVAAQQMSVCSPPPLSPGTIDIPYRTFANARRYIEENLFFTHYILYGTLYSIITRCGGGRSLLLSPMPMPM